MLKTRRSQSSWHRVAAALVPITLGAACLTAAAPASAGGLVIERNYSQPYLPNVGGTWLYGSPIPTPVPVNPVTGRFLTPRDYYYPAYPYQGNTVYSTPFNPALVGPRNYNSIPIHPGIVNRRGRGYGYQAPGYYPYYPRQRGVTIFLH